MAALEPPSTISSTNGRIASKPAVCGVKARVVASGVNQSKRQARRDSLAAASRIAATSPRSSPSETINTAAPRA